MTQHINEGFNECERGNDLFQNDDGNIAAWINLEDDMKLEITFNNENYPALNVRMVKLPDEKLAEHVNSHLQGWVARKCNTEGINLIERHGEFVVDDSDDE